MRLGYCRLKMIDSRCFDAVPLVNVAMLLLLFFVVVCGYSAQTQAGIKVNLPKAVTSETIAANSAVISVTREKVLYLNDEVVSPEELTTKLESSPNKEAVIIKADKGTSLERVVEVWDICRKLGIRQVNIATTQSRQ